VVSEPDRSARTTTADTPTPTTTTDRGTSTTAPAPEKGSAPTGGAPEKEAAPAGSDTTGRRKVRSSLAGSTWVALIIGALILVLLLVFILQNMDTVTLHMFAWQWNFPIGVGMLIAAVGGALVMASVGVVRIVQLRRQVAK
jgi:uncharacterized integral membrane protein